VRESQLRDASDSHLLQAPEEEEAMDLLSILRRFESK
jgi:hypothetical protein